MRDAVPDHPSKWRRDLSALQGVAAREGGATEEGVVEGIKVLYAGQAMTMWETPEEAEASWRVPSVMDRLTRTTYPWWRASKVVVVEPPSKT